jgi:hypothetical protein
MVYINPNVCLCLQHAVDFRLRKGLNKNIIPLPLPRFLNGEGIEALEMHVN